MRKIIKITSILSIATLVKMFAGVIRAKFLAWQIGPEGVGVVSQALVYSLFAIQLCSLNICTGITKKISESFARNDASETSLVVKTSVAMQFAASILFMALVLPFSRPLTKIVFQDARYWPYFIGITIATPFALFLTGIVDPVFYALRKIAEYTKLMIAYTLFGLCVVFPAVYLFKTEGMLVQIAIAALGGFVIARRFFKKALPVSLRPDFGVFGSTAPRAMMGELFRYGMTSFVMANVNMCVVLYLRGLVIKQFGLAANGHYQVAFALSAYYLPFITNAVWGYFYPEMCALGKNDGYKRVLDQFITFALFISTAAAASCIIFREYIILILYSREFMPAYGLLPIQAAGDIFFVIFFILNTSLLARRRFKTVILASTMGYNAVLVSLYLVFANVFGFDLKSLNAAVALTNIVLVAALLVHHKFDIGFIPSRRNAWLFLKSMALVAVLSFLPGEGVFGILTKVLISLLWLAATVTKEEFKSSMEFLSSSFKGRVPDA
jgi:PST family polysaccharide transporter